MKLVYLIFMFHLCHWLQPKLSQLWTDVATAMGSPEQADHTDGEEGARWGSAGKDTLVCMMSGAIAGVLPAAPRCPLLPPAAPRCPLLPPCSRRAGPLRLGCAGRDR